MKTLAVKLKPEAEKIVKKGHPWVFSKSIRKLSPEGQAGDLAILFDQRSDRVYAIGLYDPASPICIKIIHHGGGIKINRDFFRHKIEAAFRLRAPLFKTNTNAYRLLFGENDGFPGLIVDIYDQVGVVKLYSAAWFPYLNDLVPSLIETSKASTLMLRLSRNLQKIDSPYREGQLLYGTLPSPEIIFREYGVKFKINVILGHKTGFFLDHRFNRHQIGQFAQGKTVLDVFSYAGGFSIHALAGGAKEVTSIDFSEQALELARENADLNPHSGKYQTIAGDAFEILKGFNDKKRSFDLVIIDPPSFAKSEKEKAMARKKYAELARLGAGVTHKNGVLLLASCSSRITCDDFLEIHQQEFLKTGISFQIKNITKHDIDHPVTFAEGTYLKSIYYKIL